MLLTQKEASPLEFDNPLFVWYYFTATIGGKRLFHGEEDGDTPVPPKLTVSP